MAFRHGGGVSVSDGSPSPADTVDTAETADTGSLPYVVVLGVVVLGVVGEFLALALVQSGEFLALALVQSDTAYMHLGEGHTWSLSRMNVTWCLLFI